jgi:hypothetical protein
MRMQTVDKEESKQVNGTEEIKLTAEEEEEETRAFEAQLDSLDS